MSGLDGGLCVPSEAETLGEKKPASKGLRLTTSEFFMPQLLCRQAHGVTVNSQAHVTIPNFVTSNGVMHTIDQVLIPPLLDPRPDHLQVKVELALIFNMKMAATGYHPYNVLSLQSFF